MRDSRVTDRGMVVRRFLSWRNLLICLLLCDGIWLLLEFSPALRSGLASFFRGVWIAALRAGDVSRWSLINWVVAFSLMFAGLAAIRFLPQLLEGYHEWLKSCAPQKRLRKHQPKKPDEEIDVTTKILLDHSRRQRRG